VAGTEYPSAVKRCRSCGRQNPDDTRFCGNCGALLGEAGTRDERKVVTVLFADLVDFTTL
jgi:class 3 adenylate cyclase